MATATSITACTALRIDREEMIQVMHEEHAFSDVFLKFCWPAVCGRRPILSISSSFPARSVWRAILLLMAESASG